MKSFKFVTLIIAFTAINGFAIESLYKSHKKAIIPPGTVLFEEGLYVDMTEISNFNWLEYLHWMKTNHGETSMEYSAALPDTLVWGENSPFIKHYYRHPSFHNFPVVGVSHEQALNFCNWRSDRVNEMIYAQNNKAEYEAYKKNSSAVLIPQVCSYRLPTEKEWDAFAAAPFAKKATRKHKKYMAKYNVNGERDDTGKDADGSDVTSSVTSYWPNSYGMYNLVGNVAEMVMEKGKSKGGSWFHKVEEAKSGGSINYNQANHWLGFRCVCEVNK